jgi:5-methylcytosine-specific restriction endonuclease McrA
LVCWLCGEGARAGDPWEADHVIPAESGSTAELRAAHRTCNRKRSNLV